MSDFLQHLLAQAVAAPIRGIEPRVASRFEPAEPGGEASGLAIATEPVTVRLEPRPVARQPSALSERRGTLAPAVAPISMPNIPTGTSTLTEPPPVVTRLLEAEASVHPIFTPIWSSEQSTETFPPRSSVPPLPFQVAEPVTSDLSVEPVASHPVPEPPSMTSHAVAPAVASTPDPVEPVAEPAQLVPTASPVQPVAGATAIQPAPPTLVLAPESPAVPLPTPMIEVRIGRIEIHAPDLPAPTPIATAPASPAANASRLDRYLARG